MLKNIIRFLPSVFWMGFIFFLSSQQTTGIHGTYNERFVILKSFHLIEYAILLILLFFGFRKSIPSFFIAYIYSITDEFHQLYTPGRTGKFRDTLIDLLGMSIGYFILQLALSHPKIKKFFE